MSSATSASAWVGTGILTTVTLVLFCRLGFCAGIERARLWSALCLLYAMWTVDYAVLGRDTALTTALMCVLFGAVAAHRARLERPNSWSGRMLGDRLMPPAGRRG